MDLKVVAVESQFWGPGIGVAGLLTGSDFISALRGKVHGDFVVLPSESMIGDDYLFLDDLTTRRCREGIGRRGFSFRLYSGRFRRTHACQRLGVSQFVRQPAGSPILNFEPGFELPDPELGNTSSQPFCALISRAQS